MVPPVLAIAEPSSSRSGASVDHNMSLPDEFQEKRSIDVEDECSVDEDPFANSTSVWHVIVRYMLEPVISLLPDEVAPHVRQNAGIVVLAAISIFVSVLVGADPQSALLNALIPLVPAVVVIAFYIMAFATMRASLRFAVIVKIFLQSIKLKTIVLYGPMEGGKTTLLYALQGSKLPNSTVSSMKPNEVNLILPVSSQCGNAPYSVSRQSPVECVVRVSALWWTYSTASIYSMM